MIVSIYVYAIYVCYLLNTWSFEAKNYIDASWYRPQDLYIFLQNISTQHLFRWKNNWINN